MRRTVLGALGAFLVLVVFVDWATSVPLLEQCHGYKHEQQGNAEHGQPNQCATLRSIYFRGRPVALWAVDSAVDYPEAITGFATVLLAGITGWLVWVVRDQARTSRQQMRAYLGINAGAVDIVVGSTDINAWVRVTNSGQTTAKRVSRSALEISLDGTRHTPAPHQGNWPIVPGAVWTVRGQQRDVPAQIWQEIWNAQRPVSIWGRIDYVDIFGKQRWLTYSYTTGDVRFVREQNGMQIISFEPNPDDTGNDTD